MKLWIVKRRVPLGRGDRYVRVERMAAMAETDEDAIALAKGPAPDESTVEGRMFTVEFLSGTWSAEEIDGAPTIRLSTVGETPTAQEIADRAARIERKNKR